MISCQIDIKVNQCILGYILDEGYALCKPLPISKDLFYHKETFIFCFPNKKDLFSPFDFCS